LFFKIYKKFAGGRIFFRIEKKEWGIGKEAKFYYGEKEERGVWKGGEAPFL